MNPRSLPGMPQGARKRAARRDAVTAEESGIYTDKGAEHPALLRRHMLAVFFANVVDDEETKRRYAEARARYRIGERLRPCRGCYECIPKCAACGGHRSVATTANDQDGNAIEIPCPICCYWDPCDGSGVLPAKRRAAT